MKKIILISMLFIGVVINAQTDKIFKHNGEKIEGKVLRVDVYTILFQYNGEDTQNTLSKFAIEKIIYRSGRIEEMTEKIVIESEDDWKEVVLIENMAYTAGLKRGGEKRGKTSSIRNYSANTADEKSTIKLKRAAAKAGFPFVLLTSSILGENTGSSFGNMQGIKTGITYGY